MRRSAVTICSCSPKTAVRLSNVGAAGISGFLLELQSERFKLKGYGRRHGTVRQAAAVRGSSVKPSNLRTVGGTHGVLLERSHD